MDGDLLTISTYFNPSNSRQLFILGTKQRNFNDAQATRHKLEWRIGESMKNHVYHPLIFFWRNEGSIMGHNHPYTTKVY